jgi:hypothetical protein
MKLIISTQDTWAVRGGALHLVDRFHPFLQPSNVCHVSTAHVRCSHIAFVIALVLTRMISSASLYAFYTSPDNPSKQDRNMFMKEQHDDLRVPLKHTITSWLNKPQKDRTRECEWYNTLVNVMRMYYTFSTQNKSYFRTDATRSHASKQIIALCCHTKHQNRSAQEDENAVDIMIPHQCVRNRAVEAFQILPPDKRN